MNPRTLYVPAGFAHEFALLTDIAAVAAQLGLG
jgi:dTDP-4-dehydrorhamnose 3,5-epimerase-like enzyme